MQFAAIELKILNVYHYGFKYTQKLILKISWITVTVKYEKEILIDSKFGK